MEIKTCVKSKAGLFCLREARQGLQKKKSVYQHMEASDGSSYLYGSKPNTGFQAGRVISDLSTLSFDVKTAAEVAKEEIEKIMQILKGRAIMIKSLCP